MAASGRKWPLETVPSEWPQVAAPDSSKRVAASGPLETVLSEWPQVAASGRKWPLKTVPSLWPQVAASGSGRKWLPSKQLLCINQFYIDCKHRPGERIAEFSTRFRTLLADLRTEGVTLPTGEVCWFFKQKLGLDPLRLQLLETGLAGAEGYEETEREVLRLFKDVRPQDPAARKMATDGNRSPPLLNRFLNQSSTASRPSSYAPSTTSSAPRSFRSNSSPASQQSTQPFRKFGGAPEQALVSEMEENEPVETEEHEPETMDDETDLAGVLKCEAEALAAKLDNAADLGIDAKTLQGVEETVENAAEALVTLKEARTKLAEVKRDRGLEGVRLWRTRTSPTQRSRRATASTVACLATGLATRNVASRVQGWEESQSRCRLWKR